MVTEGLYTDGPVTEAHGCLCPDAFLDAGECAPEEHSLPTGM